MEPAIFSQLVEALLLASEKRAGRTRSVFQDGTLNLQSLTLSLDRWCQMKLNLGHPVDVQRNFCWCGGHLPSPLTLELVPDPIYHVKQKTLECGPCDPPKYRCQGRSNAMIQPRDWALLSQLLLCDEKPPYSALINAIPLKNKGVGWLQPDCSNIL